MGLVQRVITGIVPRSWARSMELESRTWVMTCPACGKVTSIWEMGGIRYKAAGKPWRWGRCGGCGTTFWGQIRRKQEVEGPRT